MNDSLYSNVRNRRDREISGVSHNHLLLNKFHDELMLKTVQIAIEKIIHNFGPPPSPFSFFLMGSAGRFEQSIWSDQDHGIVYEITNENSQKYFLELGIEISNGLLEVGYKHCDGGIMANNPLWCKSLSEWQIQITHWLNEASLQSIRNLLIFIDSRSLYGERAYIHQLKNFIYESIHTHHLLTRLFENTMYLKKGVGILGQFLVETHGPNSGFLQLKEKAFFPYINAARILSILEKSSSTSTPTRLRNYKSFQQKFLKLLDFRLLYGSHANYESEHYLPINPLSNEQRKELKEIMKDGYILFNMVKKLSRKELLTWD